MAQLVSASGLGPEGPVFESQYPDKFPKQLLEIQVVAFFFIYIHDLLSIPAISFHLVHFNTHSALDTLNFMGISSNQSSL